MGCLAWLHERLRGAGLQGAASVERATQRLIFAPAEIRDEQAQVCVRCQRIATLIGESTARVAGHADEPAPDEAEES